MSQSNVPLAKYMTEDGIEVHLNRETKTVICDACMNGHHELPCSICECICHGNPTCMVCGDICQSGTQGHETCLNDLDDFRHQEMMDNIRTYEEMEL